MGRLVPNILPMGKKAEIRSQIDLPNEELHCATVKVRLECAGEMSAGRQPHVNLKSHLAMHSLRHTAAADLIEGFSST